MDDRTGERNTHPVKCDWCQIPVISFEAQKVQMAAHDPYDYNWACKSCYKKVWDE